MLEDVSYVELIPQDAARFGVGELAPTSASDVLLLVRGLAVGGEVRTAEFDETEAVSGVGRTVSRDGAAVEVDFAIHPAGHRPPVRHAMIASLPKEPEAVFLAARAAIDGGVCRTGQGGSASASCRARARDSGHVLGWVEASVPVRMSGSLEASEVACTRVGLRAEP